MANWYAFCSYMFIAAFTPGPNNLLSLNNGIRLGLGRSYPFNLGVFAGRFCVNALVIFFGAAIFRIFPSLIPALKLAGGVYILYLAFGLVRSSFKAASEQTCTGFGTGFTLQFINGKSLASCATAASAFVLPHHSRPEILIFFAAAMALFSLASTLSWALGGTLFQNFLQKHARPVGLIMAALLAMVALSLMF